MTEQFKVGMYTRTIKLTYEPDYTVSDIERIQQFLDALLDQLAPNGFGGASE